LALFGTAHAISNALANSANANTFSSSLPAKKSFQHSRKASLSAISELADPAFRPRKNCRPAPCPRLTFLVRKILPVSVRHRDDDLTATASATRATIDARPGRRAAAGCSIKVTHVTRLKANRSQNLRLARDSEALKYH
jgi:hypothetical protein